MDERRKESKLSSAELKSIADEFDQITKFEAELNEFFRVLFSRKNPNVWMILIDIINRINASTSKEQDGIPSELLQLTKDTQVKMSMTEVAELLLRSAASKHSQIVCTQDLGGWWIGVANDPESRVTDDVRIANLREAIEQLVGMHLIKAEGSRRQLFSITAEGYRIAQQMEIDQMLN